MTKEIKIGTAALVGPPNVGKSTLLNTLLGQKISIVSPKPQTTRNRIMGILNEDDYQLVIMDTPGIHHAHSPLNKGMVKIALDSLQDVQIIIFMIDVSYPMPDKVKSTTEAFKNNNKPVVLLVNKIDTIPKEKLLPILQAYQDLYPFQAMLPISALKGEGCDLLISEVLPLLPKGLPIFPDDIPTDLSERFIVSEMIREKIFLLTDQEIPYSTAVVIDDFREQKHRVVIHATIMVERKSQKGIIIGKQGKMLGQIGKQARLEMEKLLATRVVLKLWVKVEKNWSHNSRILREIGF